MAEEREGFRSARRRSFSVSCGREAIGCPGAFAADHVQRPAPTSASPHQAIAPKGRPALHARRSAPAQRRFDPPWLVIASRRRRSYIAARPASLQKMQITRTLGRFVFAVIEGGEPAWSPSARRRIACKAGSPVARARGCRSARSPGRSPSAWRLPRPLGRRSCPGRPGTRT